MDMRELYPEEAGPLGVDVLGDEFPNPFMPWKPTPKSPLMADVPGADTTSWSSEPRPTVTAWQGADLDAYWYDTRQARPRWRHCQTGEVWES